MMSTPLRQFLQSVCCHSPWDYAVFWKFQKHQNEMLLIWDDGLFDLSRPIDTTEGMINSFSSNNLYEQLSSACAWSTQNGNLGDCPMAVALAEMSNTYYVMGMGLIGEVAYTESPSWISIDDFMAGGFNSNLISECHDELLHHFVAGVKTLLIVPLVPLGVLQLGSLDTVREDATIVIDVKNKFYDHLQSAAFFSAFRTSELMSPAMIKIDEDLKVLDTGGIECEQMSNTNQITSMVQHSHQIFKENAAIDQDSESKNNMQSLSFMNVAEPFSHQIWEISESDMIQNPFGSSCVNEELDCFSNFSGYGIWDSENPVDKIMHSFPNDGIMEPSSMVKGCQTVSYESGSQNLKFPTDSELHKAFGHVILNHADLNLSNENAAASSVSKEGTIHINNPLAWDCGGQCPNKNKVVHLLEAVVANASNASDDNTCNRSHSATSFNSSSMKFRSSQVEQGALTEENRVPWSCVTSAISGDRNSTTKSPPSASSFGCMPRALLEGNGCSHLTEVLKSTDANKRRARSGDSQKPRPRDRQLIQDRIKELRELVPNGTKGSIDGLLGRTIKHMQFLTSVSDQADKIRQHIVKTESRQKDLKLPKVESNTQNGTSWALEYENEQQTCPIMVKDLEYPGHMLVEMLCNDLGRFLEIADVIHRLELTILKGAMERRSDESAWAYFIVEASGSFHRLDIFWPLMQLLQQNRTQISSKI